MLDHLRDVYERLRVWRRRRRLQRAYAKVGRIRHGLGPGISPTFYAYDKLNSEGLASLVKTEDGAELVWHWPETTLDRDAVTDGSVDLSCPEGCFELSVTGSHAARDDEEFLQDVALADDFDACPSCGAPLPTEEADFS